MNFYNEHDPKAAAWLRELIAAELIPPGDVDERSITEIQPHEIARYTQCHFFAGIGGWSLALALAGVATTTRLWTGSCPCQPLSCAGKGLGHEDERHLWPAFARLIRECSPPVVFGEQVASKAGRDWFAGIRLDLEAMGYAVGGADLCAAGVGAPHIRQRLYWMTDAKCPERRANICGRLHVADRERQEREETQCSLAGTCPDGSRRLDNAIGGKEHAATAQRLHAMPCAASSDVRMGDAEGDGRERGHLRDDGEPKDGAAKAGAWDRFTIIHCRDGKHRRVPVEPALFPLADGLPGRVGILRGAGNAIVPQTAAQFIAAYLDALTP